MAVPKLTTGDDISWSVQLNKNGAPFDMTGATVNVAVVSQNKTQKLTANIPQASGTSGADWSTSFVVVVIPSATTGAIAYTGPAFLEIEVDDGGKQTWFVELEVQKGNV